MPNGPADRRSDGHRPHAGSRHRARTADGHRRRRGQARPAHGAQRRSSTPAGGADARIAVVPTASLARPRDRRGLRRAVPQARRRARSSPRGRRRREEADDPALVGAARRRHRHLHDRRQPAQAVRGRSPAPPFGDAIVAAHARGAVVGGTSAGASIQSSHMVAFGAGGLDPEAADDPARRRARADPRRASSTSTSTSATATAGC